MIQSWFPRLGLGHKSQTTNRMAFKVFLSSAEGRMVSTGKVEGFESHRARHLIQLPRRLFLLSMMKVAALAITTAAATEAAIIAPPS